MLVQLWDKITKHARDPHHKEGEHIKSVIYGGLDGIITTFAVVAGVAGASLQPGVVLILGFANLIADGFSMAIGDYLSTKAKKEYTLEQRRKQEEQLVTNHHQKRQLIEIYTEEGVPHEDAATIANILVKNKKAHVDLLMAQATGIVEDNEEPLHNALVTFFSFALFGFIPLCSFVLAQFFTVLEARTFYLAIVLTAITLFILGALKTRVTRQNWLKAGFEMLFVGGLGALIAYGIGFALAGFA